MDFSIKTGEELFQLLLITVLFLFTIVLLFVVVNIFLVLNRLNNQAAGIETPSFNNWWQRFAGLKTRDNQEAVLLNHDFDGIRELDNHLPPWWLGMFYGGIAFGIIYLLNYHVWHWSPLPEEEYTQEVAIAQKKIEEFQSKMANSIDENNVTLLSDATVLGKGQELFTGKCAACHGMAGEGGVGPNLTDAYWLHGDGDIKGIFSTIKYGVPEKGMIAWKAQLKPDEIQNVASYILSIQGSNPPNAKEPQGELAKPTAASDSTQAATVTP